MHDLEEVIVDLSHPLAAEIRFYRSHRMELLQDAKNKYVVIKGDTLEGPFETEDEALLRGSLAFGGVPMLVQKVTSEESLVIIG